MKEKHYLTPLLEPRSVGIIGASEREASLGNVLMRNMLEAGYKGKLFAINPKHEKVHGVACYKSVEDVPQRLDLVVMAVRSEKAPALMEACGRAGVKAVILLSGRLLRVRRARRAARAPGGRGRPPPPHPPARPQLPGHHAPAARRNATFAHASALKGSIGLISQSGALCAAILDWAKPNNVGFSTVVSLGSSSDIDFGEVLEYMISDPRTESIFLYVEGIRDARRFMSALRGAARVKPVLLVKAGRHPGASRAILSHSGAPMGEDAVFDAALRRAGVIRLYNMGQLFAAANALFSHFRPRGNRLAIITNGGGPGVMAADRAADIGIPLAEFSEGTIEKLNACLPAGWSHGNPVDILGDAGPERYRGALKAVLEGPNVDGVLVMLTPQAVTDPSGVADVVIELEKTADKPVLVCWMGEELRAGRARTSSTSRASRNFRTPGTGGRALQPHLGLLPEPEAADADAVLAVAPVAALDRERAPGDRDGPVRAPQEAQRDGVEGAAGRLPHPDRADRGRSHRHRGDGAVGRDRPAGGDEDRLAQHRCTSPRWAACA